MPHNPANVRPVGAFSLQVDPAARTVTVVGSSGRGIHVPAVVIQNGDPNDNPPESFQLVTTDARLPGEGGCPAGENCFDVTLGSFLTRAASDVTLVATGVAPVRAQSNSDAPPAGSGLSTLFGLTNFGDVVAGGTSTREIRFSVPNLDPYTVQFELYEESTGVEFSIFVADMIGSGFDACGPDPDPFWFGDQAAFPGDCGGNQTAGFAISSPPGVPANISVEVQLGWACGQVFGDHDVTLNGEVVGTITGSSEGCVCDFTEGSRRTLSFAPPMAYVPGGVNTFAVQPVPGGACFTLAAAPSRMDEYAHVTLNF